MDTYEKRVISIADKTKIVNVKNGKKRYTLRIPNRGFPSINIPSCKVVIIKAAIIKKRKDEKIT